MFRKPQRRRGKKVLLGVDFAFSNRVGKEGQEDEKGFEETARRGLGRSRGINLAMRKGSKGGNPRWAFRNSHYDARKEEDEKLRKTSKKKKK